MKRFKLKTKKTKRKKITIILVSIALVLLLGAGGAWAVLYNTLDKVDYTDLTIPPDAYTLPDTEIDEKDDDENAGDHPTLSDEELAALGLVPDSELVSNENVINILLLGVDARESDNVEMTRSDSIMVLSINKKAEKLSLVSIMRDLVVVLPGRSTVNKLNAAHAFGGPGLAIKTIEGNFGIKLDYYVRVDFFAFMEIVDILGGVEIDVSSAELQVMNHNYIRMLNRDLHLPDRDGYLTAPGLQRLTGKQALAYARIRYIGNGDFDRTGRQREILDQVFTKMKDCNTSQLFELVNVLAPYVSTNMSKTQLVSMAMLFLKAKNWPLNQGRVPIDGSWKDVTVREMSCLGFDAEVNRAYLVEELYGSIGDADGGEEPPNQPETPNQTPDQGETGDWKDKLIIYVAVAVVVIGGTGAGLIISSKKGSKKRRR